MIDKATGTIAALLGMALCAGCATTSGLGPIPEHGSGKIVQHAADVLVDGVRDTRANGREVAGWCWTDRQTGRLASLEQVGVGDDLGVRVVLPIDPGGRHDISCLWHTHPWGAHVVPGPSRRDLTNSTLPWVRGMSHFVIDQHGIWQYADGRIVEMCSWNSTATNFDPSACRTRFDRPAASAVRVSRSYGRGD
jgi:hypothetical protein